MAGRTDWRDLRARTIEKRSGSAQRVERSKAVLELEVRLAELRELRGASQALLAEALSVTQPNISRIEREEDLRISTLERYVEALGGELEVRASFPDTVVTLKPSGTRIASAKRPRRKSGARKASAAGSRKQRSTAGKSTRRSSSPK